MAITLNGTTGITTPDVTSDGSLKIDASAPDDSLVVDASGNVGIGTDTPNSYNALGGTIAAVAGSGISNLSIVSSASSTGNILFADGTSGDERRAGRIAYDHSLNNLYFFTNGNNLRTTIDSSGNLLVGTTSTPTGSSGGSGFIVESVGRRTLKIATTTTSGAGLAEFINPNGVVGTISVSGSSTTYGTSSDYRLKHDIAPMTGALARVAALKPCTYKWNADDSNGEGFIAHELQEVCPSAVTGEKDAVNEDGSIKPQGIDTSFLVATLTAAIQEQQAIIESLTARVVALEGQP